MPRLVMVLPILAKPTMAATVVTVVTVVTVALQQHPLPQPKRLQL